MQETDYPHITLNGHIHWWKITIGSHIHELTFLVHGHVRVYTRILFSDYVGDYYVKIN